MDINREGMTPEDDKKFRENLHDKYKLHRLDFGSFGGQSDAAILVERKHSKLKP